MSMVLFYCDLFWIALLVTMFSGGTHFVMRNGGESEPSSLKPNMNLRARVKSRLMEKAQASGARL